MNVQQKRAGAAVGASKAAAMDTPGVTPPTPTQCPMITGLDVVIADSYDLDDLVEGPTKTFASDGFVPAALVNDYIAAQQNLQANPSDAAQALVQVWEVLFTTLYQFRLVESSLWQKVIDMRLPKGASPAGSVSWTTGASDTTAYTFGAEVGVRVWAEAEANVILAKATAGVELSAKISASIGSTYTWSDETTVSVSAPPFVAQEDCRVLVWQKVGTVELQEHKLGDPDGAFTTTSIFSDNTNTFANQVFPPSAAAAAQDLAARVTPSATQARPRPPARAPMTPQAAKAWATSELARVKALLPPRP